MGEGGGKIFEQGTSIACCRGRKLQATKFIDLRCSAVKEVSADGATTWLKYTLSTQGFERLSHLDRFGRIFSSVLPNEEKRSLRAAFAAVCMHTKSVQELKRR